MSNIAQKLVITSVAATAFAATPVLAADMYRNDSGLYIAGAYGGYKSRGGAFDDENDLLEAKLGYQFNEVFSLEASYADFGDFGEEEIDAKMKGLGLALRARLPLSQTFGIYAKAGAFASSTDAEAFDEDETYDNVDPFVGAGVDFRISEPMYIFVEYNRYNNDIDADDFPGDFDDDGPDFDTVTAGLKFMF